MWFDSTAIRTQKNDKYGNKKHRKNREGLYKAMQ